MRLLEWYFGFRPLVRFGIALIPLAYAAFLFFGANRFSPVAWGLGGVLLCCSFPTDGERNKWGDW